MVSSIRQQEIDELKAQKKTDRENEIEAFAQAEATVLASKKASDERIAKKWQHQKRKLVKRKLVKRKLVKRRSKWIL